MSRRLENRDDLRCEQDSELIASTTQVTEGLKVEGDWDSSDGLMDELDALTTEVIASLDVEGDLETTQVTERLEVEGDWDISNRHDVDVDKLDALTAEVTAGLDDVKGNLESSSWPTHEEDARIALVAKVAAAPVKDNQRDATCEGSEKGNEELQHAPATKVKYSVPKYLHSASVPDALPLAFRINPPSKVEAVKITAGAKRPSKEERWTKKLRQLKKPKTNLHAVRLIWETMTASQFRVYGRQ